jgi:hypothetical protein
LKARGEGVFKALPTAERCHLLIEDFNGEYAWPHYDERGRDDLV